MDKIVVTLDRNKVYSSYYARACKIFPSWRMVAISISIPDGFDGIILRELNPTQQLLYDYKNGLCDEHEYEERYYSNVLSRLEAKSIYEKVKGKVLLCYCGKDKFCHRKLVLKWLADNLGENVVGGEI